MNFFLSFQWISTFTIIHTLVHLFISLIPKDKKTESLWIYYHDSSPVMMYMIELCLGLGVLSTSNNMYYRIILLVALQAFMYFPLSVMNDNFDSDYLHLHKRYFEDNKHFMGFIPLMLSFVVLPIISEKNESFNEMMYPLSMYMIAYKLICSYEDL